MNIDLEGLYRLYAAVYQSGIEDSIDPPCVSGVDDRRGVTLEAREWIMSDEDYPFSFVDCCDLLQLDPVKERAAIMKKWGKVPKKRKRLPPCGSSEESIRMALSVRGEVTRSQIMSSTGLKSAQLDAVLGGMPDVEKVVRPLLSRRTGMPMAKRTVVFYRLRPHTGHRSVPANVAVPHSGQSTSSMS
jgi:hypothetical protein